LSLSASITARYDFVPVPCPLSVVVKSAASPTVQPSATSAQLPSVLRSMCTRRPGWVGLAVTETLTVPFEALIVIVATMPIATEMRLDATPFAIT
jgi:hypothetical protein